MNLIKTTIASLLLIGTLAFAKININTATVEEFTHLKGIGEKKAQAIVDYRKENGKFESIMDLTNVKGIGEKTVTRLKLDLMLKGKTDLTDLQNASDKKSSLKKKTTSQTTARQKNSIKKSDKKPSKVNKKASEDSSKTKMKTSS